MTDYAISKKKQAIALDPDSGIHYPSRPVPAQVTATGIRIRLPLTTKRSNASCPSPVFYALDTFTVNLGDADRVLYIGITLRLKDEATRSRLSEYLPEVRSRLLLLFSRQDAAVLATEEGKKNLIAEIKTTLSTPLVAGQPKQDVTDVLYTAFILR